VLRDILGRLTRIPFEVWTGHLYNVRTFHVQSRDAVVALPVRITSSILNSLTPPNRSNTGKTHPPHAGEITRLIAHYALEVFPHHHLTT